MASAGNTPIQLYYSNTAGASPTSANLISGELAINIVDGLIYYKNSSNNVVTIGTDASSRVNVAFGQANAAFIQANSAYASGNTTGIYANSAFTQANAAFLAANTPTAIANSAALYANGAFVQANAAYTSQNTTGSYANSAYAQANSASLYANGAFVQANAAFTVANNALPKAGGTISGSLTVTQDATINGNLTVLGSQTTINTSSIILNDPLIFLANNNYTSDAVDIGIVGHYNDVANAHTGIFRDPNRKEWIFFKGYIPEVGANNLINVADPTFAYSNVYAQYFKGNVITGGTNYLTLNGSNTGNAVTIYSGGSDTNVPMVLKSQGTGAIDLAAGSNGVNISNGGTVTALTLTGAGTYTSFPSVAISAPTTAGGVQAVAAIATMYFRAIAIQSGGTGYTAGDVLSIVGGTPTGATATATVSTVSSGVITGISVTVGSTYSSLPTNPASVTGGTGTGATFNLSWGIVSYTISNAGSGYVEQPTVTFSGGGGSGATAYATVGSTPIVTSLGSSLRFSTAGGPVIQATNAGTTTVNYLSVQGGGSGSGILLAPAGSDGNITMFLSSLGTSSVALRTNNSAQQQMLVSHTASAVNYVQVTGGATGSYPSLLATGSDSNVGFDITTKGTNGRIRFRPNSVEQMRIQSVDSAVNYFQVQGSIAGAAPILSSQGSDTNIDLNIITKGTGNTNIQSANGTQFKVVDTNGTVANYIQVTGNTTGNAPTLSAQGSDANVNMNIVSSGNTSIIQGANNFITFGGMPGNEIVRISKNNINGGGSASFTSPAFSFIPPQNNYGASIFNAGLNARINTVGSDGIYFSTNYAEGFSGTVQLKIAHTASAVNYVNITGAATGGAPAITAVGSDSNVNLVVGSKGSSQLYLNSGPTGGSIRLSVLNAEQGSIGGPASTVNKFQLKGASTGASPSLQSQSSVDTNVGFEYSTIGTGSHNFFTFDRNAGSSNLQFSIAHSNNAVNYVQATGGATGNGPILSSQGSDANIDLNLVAKGTGNINATANTVNIKGTGNNFFNYSQDYTQSVWAKVGSTITAASTTAPDGTSTGQTLNEDTSTGQHNVSRGGASEVLVVGETYTISVYAKQSGRSVIFIQALGTFTKSYFDIASGTVLSSGSGMTSTITNAGNGWYRCAVTFVCDSTNNSIRVIAATTGNGVQTYTGTGIASVYLWGAQMEMGSSATTYIPTTTAAVYGTPSLSFSGVAGLGLQSDGSLYVSPAGTGALQAQKTDSSVTGGNARGANAVDWQTLRSTAARIASGAQSVVVGGNDNTSSTTNAGVLAGSYNIASGFASGVVTGQVNTASGYYGFVGSGNANIGSGYYGFVGNGYTNTTTSSSSVTTQSATMNGTTAVTLSGSNASIKIGQLITGTYISAPYTYVAAISGTSLTLSQVASGSGTATLSFYTPHGIVVGGGNNTANGSYSFVGGGGDAGTAANKNLASGMWSVVVGGLKNTSSSDASFIGAGYGNIASGPGSVVAGGGIYGTIQQAQFSPNQASGIGSSVGGGFGNQATGYGSTIPGGQGNVANANWTTALGAQSSTRGIINNFVIGGYPIVQSLGLSQIAFLILGKETTSATATVITSDGGVGSGTNQLILPNNSAYTFKGTMIANVTGGGDTSSWEFRGCIKRGSGVGTTAIVGTPRIDNIGYDAGASTWAFTLTADTTNGGLAVTVTGQASTTIRWVCRIDTTEVTY